MTLWLVNCLCIISICLAALPHVHPVVRHADEEAGLDQKQSMKEALFFDMPLDHFNSDINMTFPNRYWVNDTYYRTGGPVFLFDSGEQNAEPLLPYYLQEFHGLSAVMRLAKRYSGLAILWEHRFYGASLPFPINRNTTTDQWKYLTTEQALEDVVYFANHFTSNSSSGDMGPVSFSPSTTPWIWLGGSYPGIRGALLRVRNPETFYATWASSAPVQAQIDMASYYAAAERSLTRNCSADWIAVTKHVDDTLSGGTPQDISDMKCDLLKARLSGPGGNTTGAAGLNHTTSDTLSNEDAASILMDPLDFYQYYGFEASILPFCNILETENFTRPATEAGVSTSHSIQIAFQSFLKGIAELDYDSIPFQDDPAGDLSWMWQYCSEYGFYQRGDPSNTKNIETTFLSLELFQMQCNETFGEALPTSPQVEHVNKYGGWNMQPSNIMWTNGEFDPWRTMGVASIEPSSPHRNTTQTVPPCNTPPQGSDVFGMIYDNMVHVSDMRVLLTPDANHSNFQTVGFYSPISPTPFYAGLSLFQLALDEWLPCFHPNSTREVIQE